MTSIQNAAPPEITDLFAGLPADHRCRAAGIRTKNGNVRSAPEAVFEDVTPVIAAAWLVDNVHNRGLSVNRAAVSVVDMTNAAWQLTGEAIKFDTYGHLLDGQHRLEACITSGVTFKTLVVRGLAPSTQEVMDSGARRNAGDTLTLRGEEDGVLMAPVVRRIIQWEKGTRTRLYRLSRYSATTSEVVTYVEGHPRVRDIVEMARTANGVPMPPAIRGLLWWLFDQVNPPATQQAAEEFFTTLASGAGLSENHPILTLRNKLMSERSASRSTRLTETAYIEMTIRAWNAWREGRPLIRMQINTGKGSDIPTPR